MEILAGTNILQLGIYRPEQHLNRRADNFKVAELFGRNIHQHVVLVGIGLSCWKCLQKIIECCRELTVCAAELFQQQAGEFGVRLGDACIEL